MRVVRPISGESLKPGHVYVAPPGQHLRISNLGKCVLGTEDHENYCRPSADVLFRSAVRRFGSRTLGVVLTGFLDDGARGAAGIRAAGGVVIAQDPATCYAAQMPNAAIKAGADFILSPAEISSALASLVMTPGVAAMFGVGPYRRVAEHGDRPETPPVAA